MKTIPTVCIPILCVLLLACSPANNAAGTENEVDNGQHDAVTIYKDGTRAYVDASSGMTYEVLEKANGDPAYVTKGTVKVWTRLTNPNGSTDQQTQGDSQFFSMYRMSRFSPGLLRAIEATPIGEKRRWRMQKEAVGYFGGAKMQGWYELELKVFGNAVEPEKPTDLENPSSDAVTTSTGLRYRVIKPGEGKRPAPDSAALIHYNGWTSKGELFDSSFVRNEPTEFPLNQVTEGLKEGLQLMQTGATYRFWIPSHLAYGDDEDSVGIPGNLVFDITLISFKPAQDE
ncbi:MAG: FKBP-type peptidyl-prolyl cis-trans isomerase [Arenimonas sp.]